MVLRWPLPLHWWNGTCSTIGTNGFSVSQPLVTMFFNGCQPLVQRCDGNDTSLRSSLTYDKYLEQMVTKVELYSHESFPLIVFLSRFQTFGIQLWAVWQVAEYLLYKPGSSGNWSLNIILVRFQELKFVRSFGNFCHHFQPSQAFAHHTFEPIGSVLQKC